MEVYPAGMKIPKAISVATDPAFNAKVLNIRRHNYMLAITTL